MQFKKVYIEITNNCNLNCSFCKNNSREKRFMSRDEFEAIIKKIKTYTNYVYLHVKGEPLLHPELKEILKICDEYKIQVNITTNGTLLKQKMNILEEANCVRQINISLHSENNLSTYFVNIFDACKKLKEKMYISYRLWTLKNYELDKKSTEIVDKIIKEYNLSTAVVEKLKKEPQVKIDINTYVNKDNLFSWPTLKSEETSHNFCHGLSTHFAILVDGTIVPCCLDGEGNINLGNIFEDDLEQVLKSERVQKIISGFKNNKCSEKLCLKCSFKNK